MGGSYYSSSIGLSAVAAGASSLATASCSTSRLNGFAKISEATGPVAWMERWRVRLGRQEQSREESVRLRRANCPAVIPRNHRVVAALAAAELGDLGKVERLLEVLAAPYDYDRARTAEVAEYCSPAPDGGAGYRTFCGT